MATGSSSEEERDRESKARRGFLRAAACAKAGLDDPFECDADQQPRQGCSALSVVDDGSGAGSVAKSKCSDRRRTAATELQGHRSRPP